MLPLHLELIILPKLLDLFVSCRERQVRELIKYPLIRQLMKCSVPLVLVCVCVAVCVYVLNLLFCEETERQYWSPYLF